MRETLENARDYILDNKGDVFVGTLKVLGVSAFGYACFKLGVANADKIVFMKHLKAAKKASNASGAYFNTGLNLSLSEAGELGKQFVEAGYSKDAIIESASFLLRDEAK